ncbi:winged helix-turn-helix domain-containing protein [Bradyrhizobium sp. BRP22]|uniref:ATP-binding protein n=1 Tax=Bradyrhizobium sp. BRP22 TaxID=2793821 RepID=UPI001CD40ECB|nr:winged helix-turn-helix domain-containing protein [Bradyrhizobium sp. BRP22]MCA1451613.1 winged helix-turn-helix domain-containing protein [Bradyrhizobium sp. BRP22]
MLWKGEILLQVGARALAILSALTETPGRLVGKRELLERVWPDGRVDDANLKVQISTLRKALRGCEGLIRSESSLGYRFLGETVSSDPYLDTQRRCFLAPRLLTEPIGRDDVIADIASLLKESRLVTVLGPGGIGKTTVALAIVHRLADTFADETCFVDLGRIARDDQVCEALACALDLPVGEAPALEQIQFALQGRRLLLVLDSCEHVIDAVALLVEQVLTFSNEVMILVTSRESLRVGAEFVWHLEPLEVPPPGLVDPAASAARYPAVQLFMRTAADVSDDFAFDDDIAPAIVEVCRRLDGIPRAIEMTASMVGTLDIGEIRRSLDQRLSLLESDRPVGNLLRHSLLSTLHWRCDLLPFNERTVLRRLALLTGAFTLDAAVAVAADDVTDASVVREAVVALANKSFLIVNHQISPPEYRLFETVRAYAASPREEEENAAERRDRC